ncbi:MAG: hypothetical protein MJ247_05395 [Alphaproteobacteria bacterium]|nr:hypothetical protein [Alphaproteobacteria bacterium]
MLRRMKILFAISFCLISGKTFAQTDIPPNYDPLAEQLKIEAAFVPNYRELLRDIIYTFNTFAKAKNPEFKIIIDSGFELLTRNGWENHLDELHRAELAGAKTDDEKFLLKLFSPEHPIAAGTPMRRFVNSIRGIVLTNTYCSEKSGKLSEENQKIVKDYGINLLAFEHCNNEKEQIEAYKELDKLKIPAHIDLDQKAKFDFVPQLAEIHKENTDTIDSLDKVKNILVVTNTRNYSDKDLFLDKISKTNYDLVIIDPFFKDSQEISNEDIRELKSKRVGSRRLVYAVLNISVAKDTKPYWEKSWKQGKPNWLRFIAPEGNGNIIVDFWNPAWKRILGVYFRSIMDLGYDGILIQGLDIHKTYEKIIPID